MTQWNGLPPEKMRDELRYHIIASALGRNPTMFLWEPQSQVWRSERGDRLVSTAMVSQNLTYFGWVTQP